MIEIVSVIVVICFVVKLLQETQSKPNQNNTTQREKTQSVQQMIDRQREFATAIQLKLSGREEEEQYEQELLNYCDSDVPSSPGITFRNLHEGVDELAYLVVWNRKREKMLERALESRKAD